MIPNIILRGPPQRAFAKAQISKGEKVCEQCSAVFAKDPRCTWAYFSRQRFCSSKCYGANHSETAAAARLSMRDEFNRWYDKGSGCWEWKGARDRDGYGIFTYARKTYRAPKIALALDDREVPAGHYACHHCDNPACVRPSHLYPGKPSENSADAMRRKRVRAGERVHFAKLKAEDVRAIRASDRPVRDLAQAYGVSPSNINLILSRRTWRSVL